MNAMPPNLDPAMTNDMWSSRANKQIYNTLIDMDDNMAPIPGLAERWAFENDAQGNPTRLRLFLKRNVRFHNGEVLRASDVKFSLERASQSPNVRHITGMIESVQIVNDHEAIVILPYAFVPILHHLAHGSTAIVNEKAVRELGDERHGFAPVGTGPYRMTNFVTGDRIEFARFDQYHGTPARIPNLLMRIIVDAATRQIELETGGIDILVEVVPSDVARVQGNANLQMIRRPNLEVGWIGFNTQKPPLNDVRVRQAINYAIDTQSLVAAVWSGVGSVSKGPMASTVWGSISNQLQAYDYNPTRARQLLAEAGFPNGFNTTIWLDARPVREDIAEIAQNMLSQVGINLDVRIMEWGAYLSRSGAGEHDMYVLGWNAVTGDADYGVYSLLHSAFWGVSGNRSFYSNPNMDRMLESARMETNPTRRAALYAEIQQMVRNEAIWVPLWEGEHLLGARNDVKGINVHPSGSHLWSTVYFE
jgi:peptide/nickel transport system substrate-binding protein